MEQCRECWDVHRTLHKQFPVGVACLILEYLGTIRNYKSVRRLVGIDRTCIEAFQYTVQLNFQHGRRDYHLDRIQWVSNDL